MKLHLFINKKKISEKALAKLEKKFLDSGLEIVEKDYDLAIAIGGDGAFLKMVKECNFNSNIAYVGINFGTLGFLQEIKIDDIDFFIKEIKNKQYHLDKIGIQETTVYHEGETSKFYSLNEIVIREAHLKVAHMDMFINNDFLERYTGDGILITSSIGSTAYNLSLKGAIVYDTFSTLQITPIAPINTGAYRTICNSVIIPAQKEITLKPIESGRDLLITIDGENNCYKNVKEIITKIDQKNINLLRLNHYNFPQKINEKLLTDKKIGSDRNEERI